MSIQILKSGILTTVQDSGRINYRRFGVNPNGVMDTIAARLINVLLGNDEAEAVLEIHFPAPEILFDENTVIALGGADFSPMLNGEPFDNWRPIFIKKGDTLRFEKISFGNRAYLTIKGGLKIEKWLGSASTNLAAGTGGFEGRSLQKGDSIAFKKKVNRQKAKVKYRISESLIPLYSRFPTVRVVAGAEFELLTAFSQEVFLKENFVNSSTSDRMGFRLKGESLYLLNEKELVSSAVNFGTIQLLPDGQMIILMADHQTSGGYPRIANVIGIDLPLVAQLGANDKIAFHLVNLEEAENLLLEFEKDLKLLKIGVNLTA
jgi:antagonist of KipI